ncbi:PREDICTED: uncharacterized protein LOC103340855 [Prunus mume]|uniref:Uncharacterized protein LOC103340855 n=1 Tax=Prunus mume TaxID=102107 RepID=A0ABM0PPG4_PRUMU|nr:PREDICTED: uncharacterized protein LOC103340855 [Prunus mume]
MYLGWMGWAIRLSALSAKHGNLKYQLHLFFNCNGGNNFSIIMKGLGPTKVKILSATADEHNIKWDPDSYGENESKSPEALLVEHLLREENTRDAYDLIEMYCKLITDSMPIIALQKDCPVDLKGAISSVVFASRRCAAEIPELICVRKHFTTKYGKEFVSAAVEVVGKLSAGPPDGPTKKILSAIADEHNIKWGILIHMERMSPSLLRPCCTIQVEAPHSSAPPNYDDSPPTHYENHEVSVNYNKQHALSLPCFQHSASINVSGNGETRSCRFYPEVGSSGNETDRMEDRHLFPRDGNDFSSGRKNWNRQFENATTAAEAAVDSAEMVSIAVRAAAELSQQCSSKSHDKICWSASLRTSTTSISANSFQMADRYPQKKSSEPEKLDFLGDVSMKKQSSKSEVMYKSDLQAGFGDKRSENKSCMSSFRSESTFCSDHWEDVLRGNDLISYFGLGDGKIHQSTEGMNSYGNAAVIFDDWFSSDDDNCEFDVEEDYKGQEFSLKFSSPGGNSSSILLDL